MASAVEAIYGTDVFGQQDAIARSSTSQGADVLARPDRSATELRAIPMPYPVRITVAGKVFHFTYTALDARLPRWAESVFDSLASNWGVHQGWDSYKAIPTDPSIVARLLNILSAVMEDGSRAPQLTPLADGGIQAEWHGLTDLEIVVPSNESPTYYFFDRATSAEEEGNLLDNYNRVRVLIEKQT